MTETAKKPRRSCIICKKTIDPRHIYRGKVCGTCKAQKLESRFSLLRSRSRRYGLVTDISFDEYSRMIGSGCHYCGLPIGVTSGHSIDRKDNRLGYTLENSVPSCWKCNKLKSDEFTYEQFIQVIKILKYDGK